MLDETDRSLLNQLQMHFPLDAQPFAVLGARLGISEDDVIWHVRRLKEHGIIREISAIFDSKALGYRSLLAAFQVKPSRLDEVADTVSRHLGVTHNYAREHAYNLWFTITVPPEADPEREVETLAAREGVISVRLFPAIRTFKIGVAFDMLSEEPAGLNAVPTTQSQSAQVQEDDIPTIRALQNDLPIEPRPFDGLGRSIGLTEDDLLDKARNLLKRGIMRRYGAVLRHRQAGFAANALVVWNVPEDRIEQFGQRAASFPFVTHCYQRPTYPDWPYSVFTMIHASSRADCESGAGHISDATGISDYVILFSTTEFKKTRVRYFEE